MWKLSRRLTSLDNVIGVQIMRLRPKVDVEDKERLVQTLRGVAYRLGKDVG